LLSDEERFDLVRISMDAEVPVYPVAGTEECIWTHSLSEPARSAIRVIALNGATWLAFGRRQILTAIGHPSVNKALKRKLQRALVRISTESDDMTPEEICETFFLVVESRNMHRTEELLFTGTIGSLPAAYAASCEGGIIAMVGFGEYGLRGSIALIHAVVRLVEAANERAQVLLGGSAGEKEDATAEGADTDEPDPADEDGSPSPEPSPTETDESDSEGQDDTDS